MNTIKEDKIQEDAKKDGEFGILDQSIVDMKCQTERNDLNTAASFQVQQTARDSETCPS